jgi:hypothetical protein
MRQCVLCAFPIRWSATLLPPRSEINTRLIGDRAMQTRRYLSYLLRLWQEDGDPPLWRVTLESPQGGERMGFADLACLLAYLEDETSSGAPGLGRSDGKPGRPPAQGSLPPPDNSSERGPP